MIVIDPGHGGKDPGTVRGNLVEKDVTHTVAQLVYDLLSDAGVACELTREGDETLDLETRGSLSEKFGASLVVSLHVNSFDDPQTDGALFFYWPENLRGQSICNRLAASFPPELRNRNPVRAATRSEWPRVRNVLSQHDATAILIEMGFATNERDRAYLLSGVGQLHVAEAIAFVLGQAV